MATNNRRRQKGRIPPPPKPVDHADMLKPGLAVMEIQHDPFCPTIVTQNEHDCHPDCRPVVVLVRPFDTTATKGAR